MDQPYCVPKILLVDDRKANLLALDVTLSGLGYELHEANSGQEAFEKVVAYEFAAILLDVQMPVLDGFETARLIRTVPQAMSTPIIVVTAIHQTEAHTHLGYEVGAIDYLFKPINVDILKAKIAILVDLYKKNHEIVAYAQRRQDAAVRDAENKFLKEQIKSRDEFLAMASHELKTPITPLNLQLQSFLKMAHSKTLKQVDDDRLIRMLTTASDQVDRLSETIEKLLDVARFTSGKVEMNLELVNLTELVQKTVASFEIQLNKVQCEIRTQATTEVSLICDRFRIEQVLINLLSNAIKYGAGKPIEIEVASDHESAVLVVKDHGIGIAEEDHKRIFRRFERAVSPTNYGGLGLGLFIACEIIKTHHGSIHVESALGQGATFKVKLPRNLKPKLVKATV